MTAILETKSNMSGEIDKISSALSGAQSELDSVKKDNQGYGYNYSDLASTIASAKPVLKKYNLAVVQLIGNSASGDPEVTTILTHESGQFFTTKVSSEIVEMKNTNRLQQRGSAYTYLRRYSYQAIIGMSSEDNDASSEGFVEPKAKIETKKTFVKPKQETPSETKAW